MTNDARCEGCGGTGRDMVAAKLCPGCAGQLKALAADPPDFSGVGKRYFIAGEEVPIRPVRLRHKQLCPPQTSVIVPLYKSERYVARTLKSLRDHLPSGAEIICVDDGSPDRSGDIAVKELRDFEHGFVVRLDRNTGFAHAVNVGARHASGHYLLMWNADCFARPRFAEPMIEILDSCRSIAIVGNRHKRPDGTVDSEGSEWGWDTGTYRHVGRKLADPHPGRDLLDKGLDLPLERDAVTFACCLIRSNVWRELGGLDERYRIGYWEDVDFCVRARLAGHRVAWTPNSEIVHVGNHTQSSGHAWSDRNRKLFHGRFVKTGIVDKLTRSRGVPAHDGKIVVCMIACSEEEFIGAAIESVYPLADHIVVVEGGTRYAVEAGLCDEEGRSLDRTIVEFMKAKGRSNDTSAMQLYRAPGRPWLDKREMRNVYLQFVQPGDWMILLDADEVFTPGGLWRLSALMHGQADIIRPAFRLFWNDMDTLGTGKWADYRQMKVIRWQEGWSYDHDHNMPTDKSGRRIVDLPGMKKLEPAGPLYHHYSWAGRSDEKLSAKCRYYVAQNKGEGKVAFPADYMERVFIPWRENPRVVEDLYGTHPYGDGGTEAFTGEHPEAVQRRRFCDGPLAEPWEPHGEKA